MSKPGNLSLQFLVSLRPSFAWTVLAYLVSFLSKLSIIEPVV